jgi:hypothetical protein
VAVTLDAAKKEARSRKRAKAEYFRKLYHTDKNRFDELLIKYLASRGAECCVCDNPVSIIIREKHGNYNYCERCYSKSAKCDYWH